MKLFTAFLILIAFVSWTICILGCWHRISERYYDDPFTMILKYLIVIPLAPLVFVYDLLRHGWHNDR